MESDDISKLVELTDSLVYEHTGQHLEPVEKEILRQTLTGKKNSDIKFPALRNSYVQRRCAPKLWKQLSVLIGQKVHKRNVLKVLQTIQLQRTQSEAVSQSQCTANTRTNELNRLRREEHHNERQSEQSETSQTEYPKHKTVSDSSPDSISQEFQQVANPSRHENAGTKSSIYGLPNFINLKQPGVPLLLSIGVLSCSSGLSWLANWYGLINHLDGKLPQAKLGYEIALKLNPWSAEAHYNQGVAYEDEQNYEGAHNEYQLAIKGGLVSAYNNQARLYILSGNYDAAVSLLRIGLPLAKDDQVRADMYKNTGWARLEQGRLALAKIDLTESIKLKSARAPAYCLMAQVVERSGDSGGAFDYWFKCLGFSYQPETPEHDNWVEMASQRLKLKEGKK